MIVDFKGFQALRNPLGFQGCRPSGSKALWGLKVSGLEGPSESSGPFRVSGVQDFTPARSVFYICAFHDVLS